MQESRSRVCDDFSPATIEDFIAQQEAQSPIRRDFGVYRNGVLGGYICFLRMHPEHPSAYAHTIFRRSFFGHHTTLPALRQALELVFASGVHTVRSEVFDDNGNIRGLLQRLGAREYGLPVNPSRIKSALRHNKRPPTVNALPNITRRNGELIDVVGVILTAEGLAYANRDASGYQPVVDRGLDRVERPRTSKEQDRDGADSGATAFERSTEWSTRPQPGLPKGANRVNPAEQDPGEGPAQ